MVKKRIIPIELFYQGRLIKTKKFLSARDVGDPVSSSRVYSDQDADELIIVNVEALGELDQKFVDTIEKISEVCFVPLSVGGGVKSLKDAEKLFNSGADKIIINNAFLSNHLIATEIANNFGSQSVVISLDFRRLNDKYYLFKNRGIEEVTEAPIEVIKRAIDSGAGELFIQSIDHDGTMQGYDLNLLKFISEICTIPIIIAGGCGKFTDIKHAFEAGVSAVACGSLFNFGDNNPLRAKSYLKNYNFELKVI